jgi:hypothetical protein
VRDWDTPTPGVDATGSEVPFCEPESHREGRHSVLCMAGILGWEKVDGRWQRHPPHWLEALGAQWSYEGPAHVRPVRRGMRLDGESEFDYLDDLPEGNYHLELKVRRVE